MNSENGAPDFDPFAHDPDSREPRKPGAGIAWLALLLALAAAAFTGYQWWLSSRAGEEDAGRQAAALAAQRAQAELERSVQALETRIAALEQNADTGEIPALNAELGSLQGRFAEVSLLATEGQARLDSLETMLLSMGQRIAAAETSIAALAVSSDSPGARMELAEVEYLLRLASERLQLFGDPRSAGQALALADERLGLLDDPLYLPVRRRIDEAVRALSDIPLPDTLRLTNRIAALQSGIPVLPFQGEMPVEPVAVEPAADEGLWARFKRTMAGLVTVRRRVPEEDVMLSLEDKDYVRQGLWLQLESARLAVMRADAITWQATLQRAADTLGASFESRSREVSGAIAEVRALLETDIAVEMPDISAPWAQLRLLREGRAEGVVEPVETLADPAAADGASEPETGPDDGAGPAAGAG